MAIQLRDMGVNTFFHFRPDRLPGHPQLVIRLQPRPDLGRYPKVLSQAQRGVGRDGALAVNDGADPARGDDDITGKPIDTDPHWLHELLQQDLARMNRLKHFLSRHYAPLMVIHNLNIISISVSPPETYPPLVIDTDAALTPAVALQQFQSISRWHTKVIQTPCTVKIKEPSSGNPFNGPEPGNRLIFKQCLSVPATE